MLLHRVLTAVVALPFLIWLLSSGFQQLVYGLFFFISVFSCAEASSLIVGGLKERVLSSRKPVNHKRERFVGGILGGFFFLFGSLLFLPVSGVLVLCGFLVLAALVMFFAGDIEESFVNVIGYWGVVCYSSLPWVIFWGLYLRSQDSRWIFLLFAIIMLNDTFAYFVGRLWGKNKLAKKLSPKKTIEGALGGLLGGLLGAFALNWFYQFEFGSHGFVAILAILCGVAGGFGDLLESLFKRFAQVKDSGKFLPGHGGLLDRVDSLYLGAATMWLTLEIYELITFS